MIGDRHIATSQASRIASRPPPKREWSTAKPSESCRIQQGVEAWLLPTNPRPETRRPLSLASRFRDMRPGQLGRKRAHHHAA